MHPTPTRQHHTRSFFIGTLLKRYKASDMHFYYLQDRKSQKQFHIYWVPGPPNLGEYNTNNHSPDHHRLMCPNFLHTELLFNQLLICLLQGCVNSQSGARTSTHGKTNQKSIIPLIPSIFNPKDPTYTLALPNLVVRIRLREKF